MTWSTIWTAVDALGTWATALIAFGGILFVNKQLTQVERTIRGDVHERLTAGSIEILKLLAEHTESYPYFYEGKSLTSDDSNRVFVLYAAEIFANYMENVLNQADNMTNEDQLVWRRFIIDTLKMAPAVRDFLLERRHWYSPKLIRLVEDIKKGNISAYD